MGLSAEAVMPDTEWPYDTDAQAAAMAAGPHPPPPGGPAAPERSAGWEAFFCLVSHGLYFLYWLIRSFADIKRHTRRGIGGRGEAALLGATIGLMLLGTTDVGPWVLFLLPVVLTAQAVLLDREIVAMYRQREMDPPFHPWSGLWVLLPLIGLFVWWWRTESALNSYWHWWAVEHAR